MGLLLFVIMDIVTYMQTIPAKLESRAAGEP